MGPINLDRLVEPDDEDFDEAAVDEAPPPIQRRGEEDADAPVPPPPVVARRNGAAANSVRAVCQRIRRVGGHYYYWFDPSAETDVVEDPDLGRLPRPHWLSLSAEQLLLRLVRLGFSRNRPRGGGLSQVEQIFDIVNSEMDSDAALPLVFVKKRVVEINGGVIVNIANRRVVTPVEDSVKWGEGFPWISRFLDGCWSAPKRQQKLVFLHWLAVFFRSAHSGEGLRRGQALVLAGPPGAGKQFFQAGILGQLFGGYELVDNILSGRDQFTRSMFASALWLGNDLNTSEIRADDKMTMALKRLVANDTLICRGMHQEQISIPWCGRIVLGCNEDIVSLQVIPNMDLNNSDKFLVLQMQLIDGYSHPDDEALRKELPAFARWLLDMPWDPSIIADNRWGMKAWQHPEVLEMRHSLSTQGEEESMLIELFEGILEDARVGGVEEPCALSTTGLSATGILNQLALRHHHVGTKGWTGVKVGRVMARLAGKTGYGLVIEQVRTRARRAYIVRRAANAC